MVIDISQEVLSCKVYPGDPAPELQRLSRMEDGALYNLSSFSMCAHNGTHIDAPAHFFKDGKTVGALELSVCIGDCYVTCHPGLLSGEDAEVICSAAAEAGCHERILLSGQTVVTEDAARVFVRRGVRLVGVDSQSVGPEDAPMAVHLHFLRENVILLEGLVLSHIPNGTYMLCALPLNIAGCEGTPCRAILMDET